MAKLFTARAAGYTLIEVLVAIVVFSLGLAGMAALMIANVTGASTAHLRSVATMQAEAMSDIMHAQHSAFACGLFTSDPATAAVTAECLATKTTAEIASARAAASAAYNAWRAQVAITLPSGQGFICVDGGLDGELDDGQPAGLSCDGDPGGVNVVKIFWLDERNTEDRDVADTFHRFSTMVVP